MHVLRLCFLHHSVKRTAANETECQALKRLVPADQVLMNSVDGQAQKLVVLLATTA